jgi:hypothetical protein
MRTSFPMLLIRGNSAAAKVVRSGEPLLLLAPSLRVIGSPLEMLDGEPQLARMRRVILMCATAVLAAGAAQPPMPDDQAAARVWFERARFVSPGSESRWAVPCFEGLVPAR